MATKETYFQCRLNFDSEKTMWHFVSNMDDLYPHCKKTIVRKNRREHSITLRSMSGKLMSDLVACVQTEKHGVIGYEGLENIVEINYGNHTGYVRILNNISRQRRGTKQHWHLKKKIVRDVKMIESQLNFEDVCDWDEDKMQASVAFKNMTYDLWIGTIKDQRNEYRVWGWSVFGVMPILWTTDRDAYVYSNGEVSSGAHREMVKRASLWWLFNNTSWIDVEEWKPKKNLWELVSSSDIKNMLYHKAETKVVDGKRHRVELGKEIFLDWHRQINDWIKQNKIELWTAREESNE